MKNTKKGLKKAVAMMMATLLALNVGLYRTYAEEGAPHHPDNGDMGMREPDGPMGYGHEDPYGIYDGHNDGYWFPDYPHHDDYYYGWDMPGGGPGGPGNDPGCGCQIGTGNQHFNEQDKTPAESEVPGNAELPAETVEQPEVNESEEIVVIQETEVNQEAEEVKEEEALPAESAENETQEAAEAAEKEDSAEESEEAEMIAEAEENKADEEAEAIQDEEAESEAVKEEEDKLEEAAESEKEEADAVDELDASEDVEELDEAEMSQEEEALPAESAENETQEAAEAAEKEDSAEESEEAEMIAEAEEDKADEEVLAAEATENEAEDVAAEVAEVEADEAIESSEEVAEVETVKASVKAEAQETLPVQEAAASVISNTSAAIEIKDEAAPQAEASVPENTEIAVIPEPVIPQALPSEAAAEETSEPWAVMNLACVLLSALIALGMILSMNRKDETAEDEGKEVNYFKLLGIAPAVLAALFFLLSEEMGDTTVLTDKYTLTMALFPLVSLLTARITADKEENKKDESDLIESPAL